MTEQDYSTGRSDEMAYRSKGHGAESNGGIMRRGLTPLFVGNTVMILIVGGFLGFWDTATAQSEPWQFEYVHAPRQFTAMRDRSLRLDADGRPHVAYGKDGLYHAWSDGLSWYYDTVDHSPHVGAHAALAIDKESGLHISYFDDANRDLKYAYRPGTIQIYLTGDVIGSDLWLSWTEVLTAESYWVYGASNYPYFLPGQAPGYEYRIDVVSQGTTVWLSPYPVGDPMSNWTYLLSAVDEFETELARSNRVGEFDMELEIPE